MEQNEIFYAKESPEMRMAFEEARKTFKYFWRELWWERHRIVPALGMACVKATFRQEDASGTVLTEHMWIGDVAFDGLEVRGTLLNQPGELTIIKEGDLVAVPLGEIADWLFTVGKKAYGGFSIHALRRDMDKKERKKHDKAWGLDFGDPDAVQVVYEQDKHPEYLTEHPMCRNMGGKFKEFLTQNTNEVTYADELGYTMLHQETIAGNRLCVEALLEMGADRDAKTKSGHTPADFAKIMQWEHLQDLFA